MTVRLHAVAVDGEEIAAIGVPGRGLVPVRALEPGGPPDVLGLLTAGFGRQRRRRLAEQAAAAPDDAVLDPAAVRPAPLLRRPRKLWGIGLNYRDHADDLSAPFPDEPASFMKGDHTIIGPGGPIVLPAQSGRVTAEAELGLVIGRACTDVGEPEALDAVAGVVCVLDQTAEDILERNPRYLTRAKNFATFLVLGAELVTLDELGPLEDVRVATWHNGELHRDNVVGAMAFPPAYLVSFHSKVMPLYPGDVISTGTPGAVVLADGDTVECRIDGVGTLASAVTRARG